MNNSLQDSTKMSTTRTAVIQIRVEPEVKQRLTDIARSKGMTVTGYFMHLMQNDLKAANSIETNITYAEKIEV